VSASRMSTMVTFCSNWARAVYTASASARDSLEPLRGAKAQSNRGGGGSRRDVRKVGSHAK